MLASAILDNIAAGESAELLSSGLPKKNHLGLSALNYLMTSTPTQQVPQRKPLSSKLAQQIKSPHAQIAAAAGASILALAISSRWLVPSSFGYLFQAFPPFLAVVFEAVYAKHPDSKICTTWYWVLAIVIATALVIGFHMI